jgi:hypothetical protein
MSRHLRPYIKRNFGRICTETPYDSLWVMAIKEIVPASHRKFEGQNLWSFDPRYYSCVRTICEHFWGNNIIDSTGGVPEPQTSAWKEPWEVWKNSAHKSHYDKDYGREYNQNAGHRKQAGPSTVMRSSMFATLFVTENAPKSVVTAAYRALAKEHHPDTGGDAEVMARINHAYDQLKKLGKA